MTIKNLVLAGAVSAAMVLPLVAAEVESASDAGAIIESMRPEARAAVYHAGKLQTFARNPELNWESHALEMTALRHEVNDMGAKVARLEAVRSTLPAEQQAVIDRIAATVQVLADDTENAIAFGNTHQDELWRTTYRKDTDNLYSAARTLARSVKSAATAA